MGGGSGRPATGQSRGGNRRSGGGCRCWCGGCSKRGADPYWRGGSLGCCSFWWRCFGRGSPWVTARRWCRCCRGARGNGTDWPCRGRSCSGSIELARRRWRCWAGRRIRLLAGWVRLSWSRHLGGRGVWVTGNPGLGHLRRGCDAGSAGLNDDSSSETRGIGFPCGGCLARRGSAGFGGAR